jgi:hypothetical protein
MLTETQVNVLEFLASSVWLGLLVGGSSGLIADASVPVVRTHRIFAALPGSLLAMVPAAAFGITVSLIFGLLQMVVCTPGEKAGWNVPEWLAWIQITVVLVAGLVGAFVMLRHRLIFRPRIVGAFVLFGAIVGCMAHLDTAFDGYFPLQTNARLIRQAVIGFLVGGIIVLLLCLLVRLLNSRRDEISSA